MVVVRALLVAALVGALGASVAAAAGPAEKSANFLENVQRSDGGFAERGRPGDASLTAWAALALVAGGGAESSRGKALANLRTHESDVSTGNELALHALARAALGDRPRALIVRLRSHRPGVLVNETMWTILALRALGEEAPPAYVKSVLAAQHRSGGWSWARKGAPDSNDTAAAIQALWSAGIDGSPIRRAVGALRSFQNEDGGFGLTKGRASDAQSTAWAIQALLAAGLRPGKAPFRYLSRIRRDGGSYRYSTDYATTPVWVTSQVVPALAGRPFPLVSG